MTVPSPGTTAARAGDMIRRNSTGGLQLKTKNITCAVCGAISKPLEIEFVATADAPSEIIDVISWIHCPKCGPRKQPAQSELGQKATIDYIVPIQTPDPRCN